MDEEERRLVAVRLNRDETGAELVKVLRANHLRQVVDGGLLEKGSQRQRNAQLGADPCDELDGEQRVPAELEEIVQRADRRDAEHGFENAGQLRFKRIARRHVISFGCASEVGTIRGGECGAVDLAVGGEREGGEPDDGGGEHEVGQAGLQGGAELGAPVEGGGVAAGGGEEVGDEAGIAGAVLADECDGVADLGLLAEDGFELAELDAEAAELDLLVEAAEDLELAVGEVAGEIAGAVEACGGLAGCGEGIGPEAFGGEVGAAEVAAGEGDAGDAELAGEADGDELAVAVEQADGDVGDGAANRGRGAGGPGGDLAEGRADGGLGGAVGVEERATCGGARIGPPGGDVGAEALAGGDEHAQCVEAGGVEDGEQGGRQGDGRDGVAAEQAGEFVGIGEGGLGGEVEGGAAGEGHEGLGDGGVEGEGGELQDAIGGGDAEGGDLGADEVGEAAVLDEDAFGAAGGAGGVDDVGEVIGGERDGGRGGGQGGEPVMGLVERERDAAGGCEPGQGGQERAVREDETNAGVGEHEAEAVGGVVGIEGEVGGAGLEGGEECDEHVEGAGEGDADEGLGAGALGAQPVGKAVSAGVEIGVGEGGGGAGVDEDGGRCGGGAGGAGLEIGVDGAEGGQGGGRRSRSRWRVGRLRRR